MRRTFEIAINLRLTGSTVLSHLREDPLLLVVQVSRRAPRRLTRVTGSALLRSRRGVTRATGLWLLGDLDAARAELTTAVAAQPRSSEHGLRLRWAAELAVQLGVKDIFQPDTLAAFPRTAARAFWQRGDLSAAVTLLDDDRRGASLRRRLASEIHMTTASIDLESRPSQTTRRLPQPTVNPTGITVLHLLTNSLPHTQSGYAHRSHAVLRAQQGAGLRVTAATRLGYPVAVGKVMAKHTDTIDGVDYHRLLLTAPGATLEERLHQSVRRIIALADEVGADVVHATTNYANGVVARAAAREIGIPWAYEVRGLLEETWVASRPAGSEQDHAARSERYHLLRERETEIAGSADHVFTLSETLRNELVARGLDRDRISLVPNAVDAELLSGSLEPAHARRALGMPDDGFWIGTVSSLVDYEGLDTLLGAVAILRGRGLDARALIVGDGVSRGALEAEAHRLGIERATVFTGRVPRERALIYHQALDVFVVPRRDVRVCRLVTPLKPIEAMAFGRPVVASNLPALAEIVSQPESGFVVKAGDAEELAASVLRLMEDPQLRHATGARGKAFASSRNWDSLGETYARTFAQMTTKRAAP